MFSARTKLGLRLLNELEKEAEQKMTSADLKRRIGVSIRMRELELVLHDLKNASLIGSDWKSNRRMYFCLPGAGESSLYELIQAVDGKFSLWGEYRGYPPGDFTRKLTQVADAETRVDHAVDRMLKGIPLSELIGATPQEQR